MLPPTGRPVSLKKRAAISSCISSPSLSFGVGINSVLDHLLDRPQPFVGNRRYAFQAAVAWRARGRSLARCALPLWLSCGLDASSPAQSSWRAVVCKSDQETKSGKQHRTAVQAAGSI